MNLRNASVYNIGLDLGTGSVGWAVTDAEGSLLHFNGKPTWGSRIFPTAETAAAARMNRGQRRRYERRRWRLNLLRGFFESEMNGLDPEFFTRLAHSRLVKEERSFHSPLFNGSDFTEREYYKRFPTVYHLRAWLMETDEKADLRLIYLAFHNIVKVRGNFLHQDNPSLSAEKSDMGSAIEAMCSALSDWCAVNDVVTTCDNEGIAGKIADVLKDSALRRSEKRGEIKKLFGFDSEHEKGMGTALGSAFVGLSADFSKVFFEEVEGSKFKLGDDEKVEAYRESVLDEGATLFDAICAVNSAYVLSGILSSGSEPIYSGALQGSSGRTISYCKVREYEKYKADLKLLKELVRTYAPKKYNDFFRGKFYEGTNIYDPAAAKGYTKYDAKRGAAYEDFFKETKKLLDATDAVSDPRYAAMLAEFAEERFLRRLKTSDNGSIPYQLHLEEMDAIIRSQGRFYPFLNEQREKIESLVSFRIPYYVGPLTQKNAARDDEGKLRFAWANRLPGKEDERVYPWNWDQIIDKNGAAHAFINRMTSDCTYLLGEPVLPKCSLLYQEFCVLNELNGARYTVDGDKECRFDRADRAGIIKSLFGEKRSVSYKAVEDWLRRERGWAHAHVRGGQGETKFESVLSSYRFFCKDVFHVAELSGRDVPMVETIILWNTLFEDRSILREELERHFGPNSNDPRLTAEQIKVICKKRFTGWGKLSEEFLCGLKTETDNGPKSIMDVMREGDPSAGGRSRAMVLMEALRDEHLGFQRLVDERNEKTVSAAGRMRVEDIPGSPALRRTVNQATRIVEEIVGIAGHAPQNIFIETTRDDDENNKGHRTKRRFDKIKEAVEALKRENATQAKELLSELRDVDPIKFDDESLVLYFMQGGKSLYSGVALDIRRLSEYQVDHIIPQSYIKDDSFENKALVLRSENQTKTDNLLIGDDVRHKMSDYWKSLHDAGLIGDKKYNNLKASSISEGRIRGFIARQLVETSQIVKLTKMMLESRVPEARVVSIRASLSHELREARHYYKCREINDFHHAHDALLAAEVGRFLLKRHGAMFDNVVGYAHVVRAFVRAEADEARRSGKRPGSTGFFISSFLHSGFDKETGEVFKDDWDAEFECERIRKYLNYKQVYISRMPEETSGAFWDASIYSPRNPKGRALSVKEGLDPKKYGSFSREQFAYFFVYEYRDKKGKRAYAFSPVPVRVASAITGNAGALEAFAREEAQESGGEFVRILRRKVYKYQLIEVGADRLYITGKKQVRNARQLAFSQEETLAIMSGLSSSKVDAGPFAVLLEKVAGKLRTCCPRLAVLIGIGSGAAQFEGLAIEEVTGVLASLVALGSAKSNCEDLRAIGSSRTAGCIQPTFPKLLKTPGITFIDQSVTGMFERRTTIGGV